MKVGTVAILGLPNAGKSTFLNALLSKKVSIVTPKAQTTRDDIIGIYEDSSSQIAFIDTPGLIKGSNVLEKEMMRKARRALSGIDCLLFIIDVHEKIEEAYAAFSHIKTDAPILILLNKIDLMRAPEMEKKKEEVAKLFAPHPFLELSAKNNFGLKEARDWVTSHLPEGEPFYDEGTLTDKDIPFFIQECVREKLLRYLRNEVPHQCAVAVEHLLEDDKNVSAKVRIFVDRDSQKGILIGKNGSMIEKIRNSAEHELSSRLNKYVSLHLFVQVSPKWRDDPRILGKLGYVRGKGNKD